VVAGRFTARYEKCLAAFERECIGPGRVAQTERLEKAWRRENTRFKQDYNDKLFNGLVMVMLVDILIFRFIIKLGVMETLGWLGFIFLQVGLLSRNCCISRSSWHPPRLYTLAYVCLSKVGFQTFA
jgi:hypothetical protein